MREVMFRGKRLDDGKWITGYLFKSWGKAYILWGTTNGVPNMKEVDPKTVGESVNLLDKEHKLIFEGDVVNQETKFGIITGYILYLPQECGYVIVFQNSDSRLGHRSTGSGYEQDSSLEIIGNIYDSPRLLPWHKEQA